MLLRIIYQICFMLVKISFFLCKQSYTVILSAETLGRKSLLWILKEFPLITFHLYYILQDSYLKNCLQTLPWAKLSKTSCLPPKGIVGLRNLPFGEILDFSCFSPWTLYKEPYLADGSFFFFFFRFWVLRAQIPTFKQNMYEKNDQKLFLIDISFSGCSYQPWRWDISERLKENPADIWQ